MILSQSQIDELHEKLRETGLVKVKENLKAGVYGEKSKYVDPWVNQQEEQKADAIQERTEAREETNIQLSVEANKLSKTALVLSGFALVVSIIGVLIAYFKP